MCLKREASPCVAVIMPLTATERGVAYNVLVDLGSTIRYCDEWVSHSCAARPREQTPATEAEHPECENPDESFMETVCRALIQCRHTIRCITTQRQQHTVKVCISRRYVNVWKQ